MPKAQDEMQGFGTNDEGNLPHKRSKLGDVAPRHRHYVMTITHGELVVIGIAMGGENAVQVDNERAMALEDTLILCVGKHRGKGSTQLPMLHAIPIEKKVDEVLLYLSI